MRRRCRLVVTGRVQNVGLRAAVRRQARRQQLAGWVRNEPDGTLRTEVEGEAAEVALFTQWLRSSPGFTRVAEVAVVDVEPTGDHEFVIKH